MPVKPIELEARGQVDVLLDYRNAEEMAADIQVNPAPRILGPINDADVGNLTSGAPVARHNLL
jgi:hypothetical protein